MVRTCGGFHLIILYRPALTVMTTTISGPSRWVRPAAPCLRVSKTRYCTISSQPPQGPSRARRGNSGLLSRKTGIPGLAPELSSCDRSLETWRPWISRCIWIGWDWFRQQSRTTAQWRTEKWVKETESAKNKNCDVEKQTISRWLDTKQQISPAVNSCIWRFKI